jgi:hypothetical protein
LRCLDYHPQFRLSSTNCHCAAYFPHPRRPESSIIKASIQKQI